MRFNSGMKHSAPNGTMKERDESNGRILRGASDLRRKRRLGDDSEQKEGPYVVGFPVIFTVSIATSPSMAGNPSTSTVA